MSALSTQQCDLLRRAAACYEQAALLADACRLYQRLDDPLPEARLQERLGLPQAAAAAYRRAGAWNDAARCLLQCGDAAGAAACLEQAGQPMEAAWVLADRARRPTRARALVAVLDSPSPLQQMEIELIQIRCAAEAGERDAAPRLRRTIARIGEASLPPLAAARLLAWASAIAARLRRPDLTILGHAAALAAGIPQALPAWEQWSSAVLGDTSGVPQTPGDRDPAAAEDTPATASASLSP